MLTCRACGGLTPPGSSSTCLHCDARFGVRWPLLLLAPASAILLAACYGGPGYYPSPNAPPPPPMQAAEPGPDAGRPAGDEPAHVVVPVTP